MISRLNARKTAIKAIPLTPEVVGLAANPFTLAAKQVAFDVITNYFDGKPGYVDR
ncbi:hypothetical protein [Sinomicrobium pectinilyticum]|uniref:hypothetical protein n=1 Tax=Sinomicrobium pectinilyticum TaxID=1084421 RepID=UPI0019CFC7CB|nr:hypothetical protein [Sinomicrobium pectinilyticum]